MLQVQTLAVGVYSGHVRMAVFTSNYLFSIKYIRMLNF